MSLECFNVNGEDAFYSKIDLWYDGSIMTNSLVDNTIYIKVGDFFYKRNYTGPIDVKWFGVKGDGVTDDTILINNAVNTALNLKKDLFFPAGIYLVNQSYTSINGSGSNSRSINIDKNIVKKIKIFGEAGTKITTSRTTGAILYFYFRCTDCIIDNIFFENTHGITTNQTTGIFLQGLGANQIKNFKITNCRFEGFSSAIVAQGVQGLTINSNIFEAPLGHDNAQNNDQPAVFVWLADNGNGQCYDVKVTNNYANGYTGSDITTTITKRPMDGFVFGRVYGLVYQNNTTRNLAHEHILLSPNTINPNYNYPVLITNNQFYQAIPAGSIWNGEPLISNYGIRADCNNVTIYNNDFFDYSVGVLIYPFQFPTLKAFGYKISNNRFYSPKSENYNVTNAIKVQGYNLNNKQAYNIVITDNKIQIEGIQLKNNTSVILIYDCEEIRVLNNNIFVKDIKLNLFSLTGILFSRSSKYIDSGNNISGI